jgi:hypothetical protein
MHNFLVYKKLSFLHPFRNTWAHDNCCSNALQRYKRCKALLIAINYERPEDQVFNGMEEWKWGQLAGCHNDARKLEKLLTGTWPVALSPALANRRYRNIQIHGYHFYV